MTAQNWDDGVCGIWNCPSFWEWRRKGRYNYTLIMVHIYSALHCIQTIGMRPLSYHQITWSEPRMIHGWAFAAHRGVPPLDASKTAPWIPPVSRRASVLNAEVEIGILLEYSVASILTPIIFDHAKIGTGNHSLCTSGCPKKLAELIRAGNYDPSCVHKMTTAELKFVSTAAHICTSAKTTKVSKYKQWYSSSKDTAKHFRETVMSGLLALCWVHNHVTSLTTNCKHGLTTKQPISLLYSLQLQCIEIDCLEITATDVSPDRSSALLHIAGQKWVPCVWGSPFMYGLKSCNHQVHILACQ